MDARTVVLRGRPVRLAEGDLLLVHSPGLLNAAIAAFNGGWSHVLTVCQVRGQLCALSVYVAPDGVTAEPLEQFGSEAYSRLAVVRPRRPRDAAANVALRFAVARALRVDAAAGPGGAYERGPLEFVATALHLPAATSNRYTCSELGATLARAADPSTFPPGTSVSVRIDELARAVGTVERIF